MRKSVWLLSAGLFALSTPAFAQGTEPAPTSPAPSEAATPATDPLDAAAVDDSEVIVVTAQGRNQILEDVPIAVTAIGSQAMQNSGANDIRQLNQLAPSLLVSSTGSEANGSARIRGIGTVGDNPGLESSVAVFIDGVYRSRSGIGMNELGEIERVEVLRGPQGTLFGRNASAGLIHIFSKKPAYEFEAYGEGTIGLGFIKETDVLLVAPAANQFQHATDFYDQTAAFTFGLNAGALFELSRQAGIFAQVGLRYTTGMSEVDNLEGTGLENINDNSARWTLPLLIGARFRF